MVVESILCPGGGSGGEVGGGGLHIMKSKKIKTLLTHFDSELE